MARIVPLWNSPELSVYRFDHPVEHEDQPFEDVADAFRASFVEAGTFDLEVGNGRWRVAPGDVMLSHPGMRFRSSFQGKGFNDTCLSIVYKAASDDRFDVAERWSKLDRPVLAASNRLGYLRWGLRRAVETGEAMFAEYCATEVFREAPDGAPASLFREKKFTWYAERVHHIRHRLDVEFADDLSVSELACSVGMSMFHFTRVFTALIGVPPHRYRLEARLRAARSMLRQGRGVTEACYACGFNNLSHFSRSFARRFGANPSRVAG